MTIPLLRCHLGLSLYPVTRMKGLNNEIDETQPALPVTTEAWNLGVLLPAQTRKRTGHPYFSPPRYLQKNGYA